MLCTMIIIIYMIEEQCAYQLFNHPLICPREYYWDMSAKERREKEGEREKEREREGERKIYRERKR